MTELGLNVPMATFNQATDPTVFAQQYLGSDDAQDPWEAWQDWCPQEENEIWPEWALVIWTPLW